MYNSHTPETIQQMFSTIAKKYDMANALFSFGLYKKWNKTFITVMNPGHRLLDLCAGTGEIAFGFLKQYPTLEAILLDFCPQMLSVAKEKGKAFEKRFQLLENDAQAIPLADESVDSVTISYGIRNVKEPKKCFEEVHRVLKVGGCFGILELTRPRLLPLRLAHHFHTHKVIPFLGQMIAKNGAAYSYLAKSVQNFFGPEQLTEQLQKTGFKTLEKISLMGGIATIILTQKI